MWSQHRLQNYSGRQKLQHEIVEIFLNGGKEYKPGTAQHPTLHHRPSTSTHPTRIHQAAYSQGTRIPLIGIGDGPFGMTMRGTKPGLVDEMKRALKRAEMQGKLVVVPVNESYTSKDMTNMIVDGDSRLHSVMTCNGCNTVWNRDVNAANNIYSLAALAIDGLPRPAIFSRPPTAAAAAAS